MTMILTEIAVERRQTFRRRLSRLVTSYWLAVALVLLSAAIASQRPELLDPGTSRLC